MIPARLLKECTEDLVAILAIIFKKAPQTGTVPDYFKTANVSAVFRKGQGPIVQSVVSLTSSLRVISLTVLADSIHNIPIFFAEKM